MQAVILAAGRGTRMKELTASIPKPLLRVSGKSLLEHKLDVLPEEVDEVILVIGYQGERIQAELGEEYNGKRIRYVVQEELNGTAGALWYARELLTDRFLVLMGDDLYSREDIEECLEADDWAVLVSEVEHIYGGGRIVTDEDGKILQIEEGEHGGRPGFINTNMLLLDTRIFKYPPVPKSQGSSEFGLPQTVLTAAKQEGITLTAIPAQFWFQVTAPEDLLEAEKVLMVRDQDAVFSS